ncbi:MAG: site-specific DNA-methyltransferase [Proteobacteria bacterium]|nr:site-specific DNA-methyltransferase [Pseudomonadota bacterium]MBI3496565.1 site-specific DNA-methyltransferase [Pseudomonadota bacterium]
MTRQAPQRTRLWKRVPKGLSKHAAIIWNVDAERVLASLPKAALWDLVVTSPPYNLGKHYETKQGLEDYAKWHEAIIAKLVTRLKPSGSLCWQIGNYVENGSIAPLDYIFHPIFLKHGLKLRNRVIWRYGHGMHQRRRFSGRYEVVLWYTKSNDYTFNLDAVRIPPKYPGKRAYKGPNAGKFSSHPMGKNPEDVWEVPAADIDVWDIPNVKASHVEKTGHPCQFPVGLVERLVLALSNEGDLVFDPFAGVGSAGVAAAIHQRRFWGCEIDEAYAQLAKARIDGALSGKMRFRSHARPLYDHRTSPMSVRRDQIA